VQSAAKVAQMRHKSQGKKAKKGKKSFINLFFSKLRKKYFAEWE